MAFKGAWRSGKLWVCVASLLLVGLGFWRFWTTREPGELELAEAAYLKGDWAGASARAVSHLLKDREDPQAVRLLARAYARGGRDAPALTFYAQVAPDRMEAEDLYLKGVALGGIGNAQASEEALEAALAAEPDRVETLELLCRVYASRHRPEKAAELATRLARQPGRESIGNQMLGVFRLEMNDVEGSVEALSRGLATSDKTNEPVPNGLRALFARTLLQTSRSAEAGEQLKRVIDERPDPEAWWLLSRVGIQSGRFDEAATALEKAGTYRVDHPQIKEPAPYVGERKCAGCHREIFKNSMETRHARTFHRGEELLALPLPEGPLKDPGDPTIIHSIRREKDQIQQTTNQNNKNYKTLVEHAFGTPERYLTMVGRDTDGTARALRTSYHHSGADTGWDLTSGDVLKPSRPEEFRGKSIDTRDGAIRCLACHTTNVRLGKQRIGPETQDRGIGCEQCHGPGGNHLAAVEAKFSDLAILKPNAASSCVACHTLNEDLSELSTPREDPAWVRSPGKALTWSRCFSESAGKLSCLTCHDPHENVEKSADFYATRCLSCHATTAAAPPLRACPVNPREKCVSCHMPPVRNELLHTSLTDHYIRIHSEASASKPATTPAK
jgi:Tetratricopeptide repeat/Cytochrome c554 and c-prime